MDLQSWRKRVDKELARLDSVRNRCSDERRALAAVDARLAALEEAQVLAQEVAQLIQSKAHAQIADIVTKCLEAVFDEPYTFHILFERKRGRTEAKLTFKRDDTEVDPLTASGGGVVDVAAFALRVACLMLARPKVHKVLILDEPMKMVSINHIAAVKALLMALAKDMGIQIIMVTHNQNLAVGHIIRLGECHAET